MHSAVSDLAIVTVTWNVRQLVLDMLRSLYADLESGAGSHLKASVWVVDNNSSDGTAAAVRETFPAVQLIASDKNLGFAGGNNAALRAMGFCDTPGVNPGTGADRPRAVFLLNPDTLVQPGAVRTLYDALFSLPRAGVVGAQLSYGDGTFQHSAFGFPGLAQIIVDLFPVPGRLYESRFNGRYSRTLYAGCVAFPVDHTLGATMMLRREVIEQTGLFDEQYFMYCEEIDWSMRIRQAGWEIYTVPTALITHLEAKSTAQIRPASIVNLWTSRFRLYKKHYSPLKLALARQLIRLGVRRQIRQVERTATLPVEERRALISAYQQVMRL